MVLLPLEARWKLLIYQHTSGIVRGADSRFILTALNVRTVAAKSSIGNVLIVSETTDSVVLELHYFYNGRQGEHVFASAFMTKDGDVVRHYGYRPGEVSRGKGRTRVQLSTNQGAPDLFTSDGIRIQLWLLLDSRVLALTKACQPTFSLRPS